MFKFDHDCICLHDLCIQWPVFCHVLFCRRASSIKNWTSWFKTAKKLPNYNSKQAYLPNLPPCCARAAVKNVVGNLHSARLTAGTGMGAPIPHSAVTAGCALHHKQGQHGHEDLDSIAGLCSKSWDWRILHEADDSEDDHQLYWDGHFGVEIHCRSVRQLSELWIWLWRMENLGQSWWLWGFGQRLHDQQYGNAN